MLFLKTRSSFIHQKNIYITAKFDVILQAEIFPYLLFCLNNKETIFDFSRIPKRVIFMSRSIYTVSIAYDWIGVTLINKPCSCVPDKISKGQSFAYMGSISILLCLIYRDKFPYVYIQEIVSFAKSTNSCGERHH